MLEIIEHIVCFILICQFFFQLLYVIEVTDDTNSAKKYMKIVSITEVLLQSPMLNMIIVDAKIDYNDLDLTENHNSSKFFFCIIIFY